MVVKRLREIKVFCTEHRQRFYAPLYRRITCEVTAHILAENFPQRDFWEFCCDCQTFFFSEANRNRNFATACPVCYRIVERRYLCHECRTLSIQSDDPPAENAFRIKLQGFVEPGCPACDVSNKALLTNSHNCRENSASFRTARLICPFCSELILEPASESPVFTHTKKQKELVISGVKRIFSLRSHPRKKSCPACKSKVGGDADFCFNCGSDFRLLNLAPENKRFVEPLPPVPETELFAYITASPKKVFRKKIYWVLLAIAVGLLFVGAKRVLFWISAYLKIRQLL